MRPVDLVLFYTVFRLEKDHFSAPINRKNDYNKLLFHTTYVIWVLCSNDNNPSFKGTVPPSKNEK